MCPRANSAVSGSAWPRRSAPTAYPGHVYHGWIGYISPTAEFTPKTVETPELRTALVYQVRVYVCDARDELRLGMPATVHIDLTQPPSKAQPGAWACAMPPRE